MASELSRFIEQELKRKGIDPDDDRRNLLGRESFRIESRSHAQETQRKASKTTRNFCVGGGIFLAMVLIVYFLSKSNAKSVPTSKEKDALKSPDPALKLSTSKNNGTEKEKASQPYDASATAIPSIPGTENESNKFVKEDIDLEGETELEEDIDLEGETELEEREAEPSVEGQGYFLEEPTDTT